MGITGWAVRQTAARAYIEVEGKRVPSVPRESNGWARTSSRRPFARRGEVATRALMIDGD